MAVCKLGADDTDGMVADDPSPERMREAATKLPAACQGPDPRLRGGDLPGRLRAGHRNPCLPARRKTLAGALPGAEGLYLIATHSGVTLAPVLGKLMAETIVDGLVPEPLQPFSLERFPGFV